MAPDFPFAGGTDKRGRDSEGDGIRDIKFRCSGQPAYRSGPNCPKRQQKQRGGYHVNGSNVPNAPSYSTGGTLPGELSALARPIPYTATNNCIPNDFPVRH